MTYTNSIILPEVNVTENLPGPLLLQLLPFLLPVQVFCLGFHKGCYTWHAPRWHPPISARTVRMCQLELLIIHCLSADVKILGLYFCADTSTFSCYNFAVLSNLSLLFLLTNEPVLKCV